MSSDQAQPNRQGESTSKRHREALPATEEFDENAEEFGDNVKNRKRSRLDNTSMGTALRWKGLFTKHKLSSLI